MVRYWELGNAPNLPIRVADQERPHTAPYDPRFPNQNQTKYCFSSYVDFHRCKKRHSEEYDACQYFQKVYKIMCPKVWVEKWDEQVENGTFPGRI